MPIVPRFSSLFANQCNNRTAIVVELDHLEPQCRLSGTNTIIILTNDGSAPQGYSLAPVEYYSFAQAKTSGVPQPTGGINQKVGEQRVYTVVGDRFVVPGEFRGKTITLSVFNISGRKLQTVTGKNVVSLRGKDYLGTGVHVVKISAAQ